MRPEKYAYDKHDYATAYKELMPLAKKGDARALVLLNAAAKKIKDARGARDQLKKRMSKADITRAKSLGMAIFTTSPKIKTFAESKKTLKDVKGKCGIAGEKLYRSADALENTTAKLKKCLGKEWGGDLCSSQIDDLVNSFRQLNKVAEAMKNDC